MRGRKEGAPLIDGVSHLIAVNPHISRRQFLEIFGVGTATGVVGTLAAQSYLKDNPLVQQRGEGGLDKGGIILEDVTDLGNIELREARYRAFLKASIHPQLNLLLGKWDVSTDIAGEEKTFEAVGKIQSKISFGLITISRQGESVSIILPDLVLGDVSIDVPHEGQPEPGVANRVWNNMTGNQRDQIRSTVIIPLARTEVIKEALKTGPPLGWTPKPGEIPPGEFLTSSRAYAEAIVADYERRHSLTVGNVSFANQNAVSVEPDEIPTLPKGFKIIDKTVKQDAPSEIVTKMEEVQARVKPKTKAEREAIAHAVSRAD